MENRAGCVAIASRMKSWRDGYGRESSRDAHWSFRSEGGDYRAGTQGSAMPRSPEHERELNALVRAHSTPRTLAERAPIILLTAAGLGFCP